ncbi:hypothetical protein [Type-D symbiont of Plautia stali]|nr:hypothetical protein [Type-D symbiont of Plautia stali]HBH6890117.1 succinate dehydrogenase flavoprotein subunit [Serratia marcescens]
MNFDPQIVAQAQAFVKGFNSGHMAHVPAMPFALWQQFITTVKATLEKQA